MINSILPVSIYVLDSLFAQPLSKSLLVYLLVWHPPLHTPYISSLNRCFLFATHAHSIYNLNTTHPSDHSHLCLQW